jgi:hypothetical protein
VIHGACHCRNITFTLDWDPDEIAARACTCTFCVKHGAVWTAKPDATLRVQVADPALVSRYEHGSRTADFQVCTRCGVVPLVTSDIDGVRYAVVNVHAFEGIDPAIVRVAPANLDGEGTDSRLARRARSWIRHVEMQVAPAPLR